MSIATETAHAELVRELRQDLVATRAALERATAERDNWRVRAHNVEFKLEQFKFAVARLCKEASHD